MRNVAGIAQAEAQKSSDMFMKTQYLDGLTGGRSTVFATGTPISKCERIFFVRIVNVDVRSGSCQEELFKTGNYLQNGHKKARQDYFTSPGFAVLVCYRLPWYNPKLSYVRAVTPDVEYQRTASVRKVNLTADISIVHIGGEDELTSVYNQC